MQSHIHGLSMGMGTMPNLANGYMGRPREQTETAERAAEVRKKLLASSGEIEVASDGGTDWLVGLGYEGGSRRQRRAYSGGRDATTEERDAMVEPISVWV